VLLDYVDFVVHIFSEKARQFYDLERLWKSAKRLEPAELLAKPKPQRSVTAKTPTAKTTTLRTMTAKSKTTSAAPKRQRKKQA